jgi:hypothetical protein
MTFEVLIPVRNATEVFAKTVASLSTQTDKNFSVLVSDNFSTTGREHLEVALSQLSAAGISARRIQPPAELGRVEHWNWLHYQSQADWLKPLFAGDWLESDYVERVRQAAASDPRCAYVYTGYQYHRGTETTTTLSKWAGRFFTPQEMQEVVLRYAMQFGPPSAAAYSRTAFFGLGGYAAELPITADSFLFCTLAARFGAFGVPKALCHFNIHPNRFSITLPDQRANTHRETLTYIFTLAYHAWTEKDNFPVTGFLRLLAREYKGRFLRQ